MAKTEVRDVWGANQYEDIVKRNVEWMQVFIVSAVKALRRDGRPLGTAKTSQQEKLTTLLEAGPEFWDALKGNDPVAAAKLAADVLRARADGKVPEEGPRVGEAQQIEEQQQKFAQHAPPMGTERAHPIPHFLTQGASSSET